MFKALVDWARSMHTLKGDFLSLKLTDCSVSHIYKIDQCGVESLSNVALMR